MFHNIYYFCPISSFLSVIKHPFENHDKVYHELTVGLLDAVYNELVAKKEEEEEIKNKIEKRNKNKKDKKQVLMGIEGEEPEDTDEEKETEYSCVIIDDFADTLKDAGIQRQLNKMLIKARHIRCSFIFTLQSFYLFPKILRKQITYTTIFQCKNIAEWYSITSELLNYNKDDALKLYNYVFDGPYNHIDLDTVQNKIYKNFNISEIKT